MKEVFDAIASELGSLHAELISSVPPFLGHFFNLAILVILVFLYALVIWKGYRILAKKDILELNLNQYNKTEHPFFTKLLAGVFYFVEYILILPLMIFISFGVFTILLIFLTENLNVSTLLLISAVIISAIRMCAYYNEDISRELAKILPFMLLAVSILNPKFFDITRIITQFTQIPEFLSNIAIYLLFIVLLEIFLRVVDFIFSLFGLQDEIEEEAEKET